MLSLHYLPGNKDTAQDLAAQLDIPVYPVEIHTFPDGESRVQVTPTPGTALLFATLNNPNDKLITLSFAATALRETGSDRLVLIAPYLCYMRQDMAFESGDAVSQRIIGSYLSRYFDAVFTVDPHLHRISDLQSIFNGCSATSLSAGGLLATVLAGEVYTELTLLVGPDDESEQWVRAIADQLYLPFIVGEKVRLGDRNVAVTLPKTAKIAGVNAIIIDDMISSGMTICRCAEALKRAGAQDVQAVTVHALCNDEDVAAMMQAGISRIRSTDSIHHVTNAISLTPLLVEALKEEIKNAG